MAHNGNFKSTEFYLNTFSPFDVNETFPLPFTEIVTFISLVGITLVRNKVDIKLVYIL